MDSRPVELPLHPRQLHPVSKKNKSSSSASGVTGGKKGKRIPGMGLQIAAQDKKDAQEQTRKNQMVVVLLANGKKKKMRATEWEKIQREQQIVLKK